MNVRRTWVLLLCCACGPAMGERPVEGATSGDATGSTGEVSNPSATGIPPVPGSTSSASSTDTTTGLDDTGSSSDEGGFLIPTGGGCDGVPDGVLAHCTVECTPWTQDCIEEEACRAWANDGSDVWNGWRCVPLDPEPAGLGDPCTMEGSPVSGIDTCDVGLMCWNVDPKTLEGTCIEYCGGTELEPTCTNSVDTCVIGNDGTLPVCLPSCDPLAPTCDEGFGCYPGTQEDFVCLAEGERLYVEEVFHADCPVGSFASDEETCLPFCDLNAKTPCEKGLTCTPYFEGDAPAEHADVGACI